ncbi:MAG: NUDIX domain-containing protein [Candidatus Woesearchaeota archaeon]
MKQITKVGMAIIDNHKLLVVKEKGWQLFGVPGGTIKENETEIQCLTREMQEELQIRPKSMRFLGSYSDSAMNEPSTIINIKLYQVKPNSIPRKTPEILDMKWFDSNSDINLLGPCDRNKIIPDLVKRGIIE